MSTFRVAGHPTGAARAGEEPADHTASRTWPGPVAAASTAGSGTVLPPLADGVTPARKR